MRRLRFSHMGLRQLLSGNLRCAGYGSWCSCWAAAGTAESRPAPCRAAASACPGCRLLLGPAEMARSSAQRSSAAEPPVDYRSGCACYGGPRVSLGSQKLYRARPLDPKAAALTTPVGPADPWKRRLQPETVHDNPAPTLRQRRHTATAESVTSVLVSELVTSADFGCTWRLGLARLDAEACKIILIVGWRAARSRPRPGRGAASKPWHLDAVH